MNLFKLSIAYLIHKKLQTALSIIILCFGIIIITLLLIVNEQLEKVVEKNIANVDMVIGAKGSPMQIILSSIFHIDFPTGNISMEDANYIAHHRTVKSATPLSIGDSYEGFRIVGTDSSYFKLFNLELESGKLPKQELEIIAGHKTAKALQLEIGDTFASSHGFSEDGGHDDHLFEITGILKPTGRVQDNLLITPLSSYWHVHEVDTGELFITNLLIQYRSPIAAVQLPRLVNRTTNLQAAMPAFEITKLLGMLGAGSKFLSLLSFLLVGIAALSIFISMYSTLNERLYDMAIFRSLGATRSKLFLFILLEGIIISFVGTIMGIGMAHLILLIVANVEGFDAQMLLYELTFNTKELYIALLGTLAGMAGAVIPAINIYRSNISSILSEG